MNFGLRKSLLVTAGMVALFAGLVATFPARLALAWFAPPQVTAWGVEGTIWQGRIAELVLEGRTLGRLSWRTRAASVLTLAPTLDFDLNRADGFARGRARFSLLADRQHFTSLEAALLLQSLPPSIVPIGTAGQARISLDQLALQDGWPVEIAGRASVAALDMPGVIMTLGPFEFQFAGPPGAPTADIRSLGGPLQVDGRIELPAPGRWRFAAELAPGENPPRELIDGLAFVGEDLGGGRRRLEMSSDGQ